MNSTTTEQDLQIIGATVVSISAAYGVLFWMEVFL